MKILASILSIVIVCLIGYITFDKLQSFSDNQPIKHETQTKKLDAKKILTDEKLSNENYENALNFLKEQEYKKAYLLLEKSCDLENIKAYKELGILYFEGKAVNKNYDKGYELILKACDNNEISACIYLGKIHSSDNPIMRDFKKAFKYYHKACEYDNIDICYKLMEFLKYGDIKKSVLTIFSKHCDRVELEACRNLATIYRIEGVFYDKEKSNELFEFSCNNGDAKSCAQLAKDNLKDSIKEKEYLQRACDLGDDSSCRFLNFMTRHKK